MHDAQQESSNLFDDVYKITSGGLKKRDKVKRRDEENLAEDGFPDDPGDVPRYVDVSDNSAPSEEYQVVYDRVAIRKNPSSEGKVLGVALKGERLATFAWDSTMTWREIHYKLRGGWGSTVAAWVMVQHPKLGVLLRTTAAITAQERRQAPITQAPIVEGVPIFVGGLTCAVKELKRLASGREEEQSAEGCRYAHIQELEEAAAHGGVVYQVVHEPSVVVRSLPGINGEVISSLECGSSVETFGWDARKKWRKIYCQMPCGRIATAWVLVAHPELGALLQLAAG